ncbi:hypothetical protein RVR_2327 [Actinacidiphila reveromycinica]|uniref:Uncharacterized protein n=1 Tax=Actinacidiphila reveromycinica TaxID=659352 RepID=A0A7U3UQE9_9ACTN|nr:hypothetical protein RVR_2327 [Streptomyces sp. SN-593]
MLLRLCRPSGAHVTWRGPKRFHRSGEEGGGGRGGGARAARAPRRQAPYSAMPRTAATDVAGTWMPGGRTPPACGFAGAAARQCSAVRRQSPSSSAMLSGFSVYAAVRGVLILRP